MPGQEYTRSILNNPLHMVYNPFRKIQLSLRITVYCETEQDDLKQVSGMVING